MHTPTFRIFLVVFGLSSWFALAPSGRAADTARKAATHRVVFEYTSADNDGWNALLNNVENLRQAFGAEHTQALVVVHGKGLSFLKANSTAQTERMQKLAAAGVIFAACENTMKRQQVQKEDLLPFATTVDAGVAEIVRKQEAGWSYIRNGG